MVYCRAPVLRAKACLKLVKIGSETGLRGLAGPLRKSQQMPCFKAFSAYLDILDSQHGMQEVVGSTPIGSISPKRLIYYDLQPPAPWIRVVVPRIGAVAEVRPQRAPARAA
jgi:hypothetical protein